MCVVKEAVGPSQGNADAQPLPTQTKRKGNRKMKFCKCDVCGKIVALVKETSVDTVCCGQPMRELVPGTTDGAAEKHVPVCKQEGNTVTVTVGAVAHPMTDDHFIEWIFLETANGNQRKALKPGDRPEAVFALVPSDTVKSASAYCNIHGLWRN